MLPQPFKVHFAAGNSIHVQENKQAEQYNQLHVHGETQISLILRGKGQVVLGESTYPVHPENVFLIPGNLVHYFDLKSGTDGELRLPDPHVISIFFNLPTLNETLFRMKEMKTLRSFLDEIKSAIIITNPYANRLRPFFTKISQHRGIERIPLLIQLLHQLTLSSYSELSSHPLSQTNRFTDSFSHRIEPIFDYLDRNYQRAIRVEEVSSLLHMSKNTFSRHFRRYTRKSFMNYLTELRIYKACQLLYQTDFTISRISMEAGFNNLSNFNRQFRKLLHITPSEYRKQKDITL